MGMEISHEEFIAILKEKNKYEKIEENLRIENEKPEIMRLNSMKSRTEKQIVDELNTPRFIRVCTSF